MEPTGQWDCVVVGAGPAGLAATRELGRAGLRTLVVDEYHRPGGRLLGQLHEDPRDGTWVNGLQEATELAAEVEALETVEVRCGVRVWSVDAQPDGTWWVRAAAGEALVCAAPRVILATGAGERSLPMPGWTLPGVMTVGAGQVMCNVHRVRPGRRAVVVGVNVLSLTIARELQLAGVEVLAIVMAPPGPFAGASATPAAVLERLADMAHLAPSWTLRTLGRLGRTALGRALGPTLYPSSGVSAWGIPIQVRRAAVGIYGEAQAEGVEIAPLTPSGEASPKTRRVEADLVCLAGGLVPLVELAAAAGAELADIPSLGGLVPLHGPDLQTTCPGLYVAGNMAGVEGAPVALAWGRLGGTSVAAASGRATDRDIEAARRTVDAARNDAPIRFDAEVERGRAAVADGWRGRAREM